MNLQTATWIARAALGVTKSLHPEQSLPVLIAEDCAEDAELLKWEYLNLGAEVVIVTSIAAARERLRAQKFRLAVLDCHFPRENAMAFVKEVRDQYRNMPVVLITGDMLDVLQHHPLPRCRMWSFVEKGNGGEPMTEAVRDSLLKANGQNGHVPLHRVAVVTWLLCTGTGILVFLACKYPHVVELLR